MIAWRQRPNRTPGLFFCASRRLAVSMASNSSSLVLYGAGGHARVVADIVRLGGQYVVAGFLDDVNRDRHGLLFEHAPILGGLSDLDALGAQGVRYMFMAIGDCGHRLRLAEMVSRAGFEFPTLVHPRAVVAASATLREGTVVVAGGIVNPGAQVGAHVIVNTAASVDHDCVVADGAHIACGARLAGGVHVGRGAWIGIGATIREHVRIGAGSIVGAGAVVLDDIPDGVVAYGCPARVIRHVTDTHPVGH
jgi:UDP-N-acetylbacillosamine N-acetyltransferase